MSNLKHLIQFALVRLEIQVSANALQAGTVAIAKEKWIKTGMNVRLVGEFAICLLNITCLKSKGNCFSKVV